MSESPGNNPRSRPNRGGRNRNRQRAPRPEHGRQDNRRDDRPPGRRDHQPRQEKNPRPQKNRRRERRQEPRETPRAAKGSAWSKVLKVLTFGLLGRKSGGSRPNHKAKDDQQKKRPSREGRQPPAAPPLDSGSIETDRLHVGNLSYDATESDLLDVFKGIGGVQNVDIVYNGRTHRSKGFGFVQMMSVADARRAVEELHGKSFMGRALHLGPARSRGRDERERDDETE